MNWKAILTWGVILGVLVVIWQFVMGLTGWYAHPGLMLLFFLVIPLNGGLVVVALAKTRNDHGYGGQVAAGTLVGVVAGVLIACGSIVLVTVAVPTYFEDIAAMTETVLAQQGVDAATISARAEATRDMTPVTVALQGFICTVLTSLVTALIAAIWLRRKGPAPAAAA